MMTRCGEPDCRFPAHRPLGIPSNVTRGDWPRYEWDRRDPGYDQRDYGPPRLRELLTPDPREALVFLAVVAMILVCAYRWA